MRKPLALLVALAALPLAAGRILPRDAAPEIFAWFWHEAEFQPEGYKAFVDMIAERSDFGLLTTSLRTPQREITLAATHDQIKRGVEYAHSRGLRVALDLDVRLARGEFLKRYPEQQQWMLCVRRFPDAAQPFEIKSIPLGDHMTGGGGQYERLRGRLLAVYRATPGGALEDITKSAQVLEQSELRVRVKAAGAGEFFVAAAFEYRTPDSYAPALIEFQNAIYDQYRDVPLDGFMKDEWGFPPVSGPGPRQGDFWYSQPLAKAYGGDFVRDTVLMTFGRGGTHDARMKAVNRYMQLILDRSALLEREFYRATKARLGPDAFVGTHATWGHMPSGDAFKNGYSWWQATRDYGQTDEHWPIAVRTSLAKKMGKPVWFNQFYDRRPEAYATEVWRNARAGGRVNFHPLYPSATPGAGNSLRILESAAMRAESRVRLLNFISRAPIDCPVAVVFGHAAALNWVGPHFGDLGVDFAGELWKNGVRADVIPSSEITNGSLRIDAAGMVGYGVQRYRGLVFLNPDFEPPATFDFLRRAAQSNTVVFLRDSSRAMSAAIPNTTIDATPAHVATRLNNWHSPSDAPADMTRLTDGTCIIARGEKNPEGDPIDETFFCGALEVRVRATGVVAIRAAGNDVAAFAGSDVRSLQAGTLKLDLAEPTDIALWREGKGKWKGVLQGTAPAPAIDAEWTRLLRR